MNIAFVYAKGRIDRYDKTLRGCAATEFYYGAMEMQQQGHAVTQYEIGDGEVTKFWHRVAELLYRWRILPTRTNGAILSELKGISANLNKHDVIIATTTAAAFGLSTLKLFGFVRRPIVAIHCGIVNYQLSWWRRKANAMALRHMWTQIFGEGELSGIINFYQVPVTRIEVNQFGVDTTFWKPAEDEGNYILSVGNDERRDYGLLIRVAAKIEDKVIIVTRRKISSDLPPNVEIVKGGWHEEALTDEKLRNLYQNASLVVIPLTESPQPSGQSVCLQAMACGKPVVLTKTKGLWSHQMMRGNKNIVFVPPSNENVLLSTIKQLLSNSKVRKKIGCNARDTACTEANIIDFSARLESLCCRVLEKGS